MDIQKTIGLRKEILKVCSKLMSDFEAFLLLMMEQNIKGLFRKINYKGLELANSVTEIFTQDFGRIN